MNPFFNKYVATAKALALERGLEWDLAYDDKGKVCKATRWNLTELVGMLPPPTLWLGQIGVDPASFEKLNDIRRRMNQEPLTARPMPEHWRDLYQAVFVHQLIVQKTKPLSAMRLAIGIRRLAQAAGDTLPWEVTPDQVQQAYNAVLQASESGKLALDFAGTIRNVLDGQKLVDTPALARFCVPYLLPESQNAQTRADALHKRQNAHGGHELRRSLSERKSASKLPDERAFWELVRIVFTETPLSFTDAIRFAVFRLLIMMGFRIGEAALLPWTGNGGASIWTPTAALPGDREGSHGRWGSGISRKSRSRTSGLRACRSTRTPWTCHPCSKSFSSKRSTTSR